MHGTTSRVLTILAAAALGLTACGDGGDPAADAGGVTTVAPSLPADPPATTSPPTDPPATTHRPPPHRPPTPPRWRHGRRRTRRPDRGGAHRCDRTGVDPPGTPSASMSQPPRRSRRCAFPGRDDVLVAVGDNVDGTPAEADAPFPVGPPHRKPGAYRRLPADRRGCCSTPPSPSTIGCQRSPTPTG